MESRREDLPFQAHLVVSQCETYTHSQEAVTDFTVASQSSLQFRKGQSDGGRTRSLLTPGIMQMPRVW